MIASERCTAGRSGISERTAGSHVKVKKKAIRIPSATILPSCRSGGASARFIARKPIIVVELVSVIGHRFVRIASAIASCFCRPRPSALSTVVTIRTAAAMFTVMMMIGHAIVAVLISQPYQPATPIAAALDKPSSERIARLGSMARTKTNITNAVTARLIGISTIASFNAASEKVPIRITLPVTLTTIPG